MSNKEVKQILTDARALVKQGWIKGEMQREIDGVMCYCAIGAKCAAHKGHSIEDRFQASLALWDAVPAELSGTVVNFNDDPETTQDDVLALFDRAIESVS